MITIDMTKAREVLRDKIREDRKPKLAALDVEYMQAIEADDDAAKQAVQTKKQALRDATADPAIEAATTPEQLKAMIPASQLDGA